MKGALKGKESAYLAIQKGREAQPGSIVDGVRRHLIAGKA